MTRIGWNSFSRHELHPRLVRRELFSTGDRGGMMKELRVFKELAGSCRPDDVFAYLLRTLMPAVATWSYFVNWAKVSAQVEDLEIDLNLLNSALGKPDFRNRIERLALEYPRVVAAFPILLACREKKYLVLDDPRRLDSGVSYDFSDADHATEKEVKAAVEFLDKSGALQAFQDRSTKNLVDYVTGVEVGLDTNARKNRSGHMMEAIVDHLISTTCGRLGLEYIAQATRQAISSRWHIEVPVDKADRRFDFAIRNGRALHVLEVNYYHDTGTKLKSTAGEYIQLQQLLKGSPQLHFIWLTDGPGWLNTQANLREAFDANDYVFNLHVAAAGALDEVLASID